jgi:radical SAM superfamily enzyme YgiQ (UPF0313 family)
MRVLLARPPRRDLRDAGLPVPPLGLAYVAAALRLAGHDVEILDAYALDWSWARFGQHIAAARPAVLGLSAMTPVADVAAQAARLARPHVGRILLGGPHPTAVHHAVFDEMPELDAAIAGEAEESAPALLAWWAGGSAGPPPPGALLRGWPLVEAEPPALAQIPLPARDLLPMGSYRYLLATRPGFATMLTSRGCPFSCSFCDKSVSGSRWRARSPVEVVDELELLERDYGVGFVNFYDDNFTLRRDRVVGICEELLRRGLRVEWKCEGRVDGVDLPLLRLMRRAGCRTVAYGVESGNQATLDLLRKDVTVAQAPAAFAATRAAGLRSLAYMILGAPGEGEAEVAESLRFCRALGADYVQFSSLMPMPGTPLTAQHAGRTATGGRNPVDSDRERVILSDLPPERLDALMRSAWAGFYLRPAPLRRLAGDAVASGSLWEAARLGAGFGRWALGA